MSEGRTVLVAESTETASLDGTEAASLNGTEAESLNEMEQRYGDD